VKESAWREREKALPRGTVIDRYTILDLLGAGGMGIVFSAYDSQLGRIVAIKVIRARAGAPDGNQRLLREGQAMARLRHPNVVTVYDAGSFDEGVFLAMEYVEGVTLNRWLEAAEHDWRAKLEMFKQAGRGLAAAHEAGLIHRDFKPENVLVGHDGRVLVGDFGLARADANPTGASSGEAAASLRPAGGGDAGGAISLTPSGATLPTRPRATSMTPLSHDWTPMLTHRITEDGVILGTVGFIAPEFVRRRALRRRRAAGTPAAQEAAVAGAYDKAVPVSDAGAPALALDGRSDQFSFCVSLYLALYGDYPFDPRTLRKYIGALRDGPKPPPAATRVPAWVHAIVARGLNDAPEARFASMTELLAALDRDPSRRRRLWALGAAVAAVCVATAGGHARQQAHHRAELRARCARGTALVEEVWNAGAEERVRNALEGAGGVLGGEVAPRVAARLSEYAGDWAGAYRAVSEATLLRGEQSPAAMDRRLQCLERGRAQLEALVQVLSETDAQVVQHALDAAYGLPPPASCATSEIATLAPLLASAELRGRARAIDRAVARAEALMTAGADLQAEQLVERMLSEAGAIPYPRAQAELLQIAALAKEARGANAESLRSSQASLNAALRAGDDGLAARAAAGGAFVLAERLARPEEGARWIDLATSLAGRRSHDDATEVEVLHCRIVVTANLGHPEDTIALLDRESSLLEKTYGGHTPQLAWVVMNRGVTESILGRFDASRKDVERAIDLLVAATGPNNPHLDLFYLNLGFALSGLDRIPEAKSAYEHALRLQGNRPAGSMSMTVRAGLAWIEEHQGNADQAIQIANEGIAIAEATNESVASKWQLLLLRAKASGDKGDQPSKARDCARVLTEQKARGAVSPNELYGPDALTCVGEVELGARRVASAIALLEQSVAIERRKAPADLPHAKFTLARGLRIAGRDPERARALAESARSALAEQPVQRKELAAIDAWLSETEPPTRVGKATP
jgi:serine/threonine protein kinase/tetratricopeptide (TPR) repeat protein